MAFLRTKTVSGRKYVYRVESYREGKKVRQRVLAYLGSQEAAAPRPKAKIGAGASKAKTKRKVAKK